MDSALALGSSLYNLKSIPSLSPLNTLKPTAGNLSHSFPFPVPKPSSSKPRITIIKASSDPIPYRSNPSPHKLIIHKIKTSARAIVFAATAFSLIGKFRQLSARADPPPPSTVEIQETQQEKMTDVAMSSLSPSSEFLQWNSESIEALTTLLQQKLEVGENEESLKILRKLVLVQPENNEWKSLRARLLVEIGEIEEARKAFEEILAENLLPFETFFEDALLMDSSGDSEEDIKRLEEALQIAEQEKKTKEARDVRLIMAQIQFLQKNVEESLKKYEELEKEDPNDFRPYFCKGMIFTLLNREREAAEQFAKYRELSPKKFEVKGYLKNSIVKNEAMCE